MEVANINGWSVESRSPYISKLEMVPGQTNPAPGQSSKNRISFTADFQPDNPPIVLKVSPSPSPLTTNVTFVLDPTLVNDRGYNLGSVDFSYVDGITTGQSTPTHSPFAHLHDAQSVFPDWENPTTGPFDVLHPYNNTTGALQDINGANEVRLFAINSAGLDNHASTSLRGYGVHQFLIEDTPNGNILQADGNGGTFYIVLTPANEGRYDDVQEGDFNGSTLAGDANHSGNPLPRNDLIIGYGGKNNFSGGLGNDSLIGGPDDDTLKGGVGNNFILGGAGTDTAVYDLPRSAYFISDSIISDFIISGGGSFDSVSQVEKFKFADVTLSAADVVKGVSSTSIIDLSSFNASSAINTLNHNDPGSIIPFIPT